MIAALVLAAGASTRLGRAKQLLEHRGCSLLRRTLDCAVQGGCHPVLVVLGASFEAARREITGLPAEVVHNPDWSEGIASSIRAGVQAARQHPREPQGVLILVCDQLRIGPQHIADLLGAFDGDERCIAASEYAGTVGTPALFGRAYFDELLSLRGDRGAKRVLERHSDRLVRLPWPEGAFDVDRPEDQGGAG